MAPRQQSLWSRLVDAFHGRETGKVEAIEEENWQYKPSTTPAGFHEIRVCRADGYDFARLVWQACDECRIGLICKIRVTGPWQRQGYGTRMMQRALQGYETYIWTTTPQSDLAKKFFPALTSTTSVEFPAKSHLCEHMRARNGPAGSRDTP